MLKDQDGMGKLKAMLLQVVAGILSVLIATLFVSYGAVELGALIYFVVPIIITIAAINILFIADLITGGSIRTRLAYALAIVNVLIGVFLRFDFYYNIINW